MTGFLIFSLGLVLLQFCKTDRKREERYGYQPNDEEQGYFEKFVDEFTKFEENSN